MTLRDARRRAELTQTALADKAGLEQAYISKLEIGKVANPSFETVLALAVALNLDPRQLRFGHRDSEQVAS